MTGISRAVEFHKVGEKPLVELLGLKALPLSRKKGKSPYPQLDYINEYLGQLLEQWGGVAGTIVLETHHIDRDFIEDHGALYSRNLFPYLNSCRRLHFFALDPETLAAQLEAIVSVKGPAGEPSYRRACEELSEKHYLGFSVIRPLRGCPVGRTVLRPYLERDAGLEKKSPNLRRQFPCLRTYTTHLLGVELALKGLAFQQQDIGVAACATTAIWSSLHHLKNSEEVAAATPSQITNLAAKNNLPFGRAMPSEGLTVGQMCQAIQAIGVSPSLLGVKTFRAGRAFIYASSVSGMAPILILKINGGHAVTVSGLKVDLNAPRDPEENISDVSAKLRDIYVHDDRLGPYRRGTLRDMNKNLFLDLFYPGNKTESWEVTHVLLAMHPKIRLSFKGLYEAGLEIAKKAQAIVEETLKILALEIDLETRIVKGYKYIEELVLSSPQTDPVVIRKFSSTIALARYVGVVGITSEVFGRIEVLIDTTGTPKNLYAISVLARSGQTKHTTNAVNFLAKEFDAKALY